MKAVIIKDGVTTGREFAKTINDNFAENTGKIVTLESTANALTAAVEDVLLENAAIATGITELHLVDVDLQNQITSGFTELHQANIDLGIRIDDIVVGSGGTSTTTYTNLTPTPSALGGWVAGSTFSGVTTQQMFDGLFYPYQTPTLGSFAITGQVGLVEVGTNLSGSKTFTWSKTNNSNIKPNIGLIRDTGDNSVVESGINVFGLASKISTLTINNSSPITKTYRLESENTNNQTILSSSFSFRSIFPVFSGFVTQVGRPLSSALNIVNSNKRIVLSNGDTVFTINSAATDYSWVAIPQTGNTQYTNWFITALNSGSIGGSSNLFDTGESILLTSATGLWTNIPYWIYITNYRTPIASITLKRS